MHNFHCFIQYSSIDSSCEEYSNYFIKPAIKLSFLPHTSREFLTRKAFSHAICIQIFHSRKWILNYEFIYSISEIIKSLPSAFIHLVSIFYVFWFNTAQCIEWKMSREIWGKLHTPLDNESRCCSLHCVEIIRSPVLIFSVIIYHAQAVIDKVSTLFHGHEYFEIRWVR